MVYHLIERWLLHDLWGVGFQLQFGSYLALGVIEQIRPITRIPFRHYAFNLGYAFVNNFCRIDCTCNGLRRRRGDSVHDNRPG